MTRQIPETLLVKSISNKKWNENTLFDLMGFKIDLGLFSSIPSRGKLIIFLPRSSKWETQNILNLNKGTGNFIFLRF